MTGRHEVRAVKAVETSVETATTEDVSGTDVRRGRGFGPSSALVTVLFVAGVLLASVALDWFISNRAEPGFASGAAYYTWIGLMALTAAICMVVLAAGWVHCSRHCAPSAARYDGQKTRIWPYIIALALLTVFIGSLMLVLSGGGRGFDVPVENWEAWRVVIPVFAIACVAPWVVCVWWTHDELARLKPVLQDPASLNRERMLDAFRAAWTGIERSTGALAATVTAGILTTGALRLALIGHVASPPTEADVLRYGLFFGVLVATVVVPLILAYRRRASEFLNLVHQPINRCDEKDEADVLAQMLHLDEGPLRSPWALIGVLTPVVTGALAAYLPGI
jgi:hypothetical protein